MILRAILLNNYGRIVCDGMWRKKQNGAFYDYWGWLHVSGSGVKLYGGQFFCNAM